MISPGTQKEDVRECREEDGTEKYWNSRKRKEKELVDSQRVLEEKVE
jgi:hypothetical protein